MTQQTPKAVYVLHGKDSFLVEQARKKLLSELLGDADRQTCLSVHDPDVELSTVLDELRTLPFLAPHRVVVVRDAEAFVSAHRSSLETYLEKPSSSGSLILQVGSWPKTTRLAKSIVPKVGEVVECNCPEGPELLRWIELAAKGRGLVIDRAAAVMLAEGIGPDVAALQSEMDKLATYLDGRGRITPGDVTAIVTTAAAAKDFALTNAIIAGDPRAALQELSAAMQSPDAQFQLLGQMAWHIRRAVQVAHHIASGQSPASAMQAARIFRGQQSAFQAMLRRRGTRKLHADSRRLIAADLAMKTGRDAKAVMQQLVIQLCT